MPRTCKTAPGLARRLRLVADILQREGLCKKSFSVKDEACDQLQGRWKEWTIANTPSGCVKKDRWVSAIKGTKRVFDVPCRTCDKRLAGLAKSTWLKKVCEESPQISSNDEQWIRRNSRELLSGWEYRECDKVYVPTLKGCVEVPTGEGGTLACPANESWGEDANRLRMTVAKSGGKMRVVTMQRAWVKEVLTPVHESCYDFISKNGWVVRGDVDVHHLEPLAQDLRSDEDYISGDYTAATDNLNSNAVRIVVDEIAQRLPLWEASVLRASFRDVYALSKSGKTRYEIRTGSMCGNLLSFIVLCILNRVCHMKALEMAGQDRLRKVRINGDDIAFCGGERMLACWREATGRVGFVVNEEKTGRSREKIELNSKIFYPHRLKFCAKPCFGFLRPFQKVPTSFLASVVDACRHLHFHSWSFLLGHPFVRDLIERRPINPAEVIGTHRRVWRFLVRKRWFRDACVAENQPSHSGEDRGLPYTVGPPLPFFSERIEAAIKVKEESALRKHLTEWRGRRVVPMEWRPPKKKSDQDPRNRGWVKNVGVKVETGRVWVSEVLNWISSYELFDLPEGDGASHYVFQPGLKEVVEVTYKGKLPEIFRYSYQKRKSSD